jgi:hypothetical protein
VPGVKPVNVVLIIEVLRVNEWHNKLAERGGSLPVSWRTLPEATSASASMTRMGSLFGIIRI